MLTCYPQNERLQKQIAGLRAEQCRPVMLQTKKKTYYISIQGVYGEENKMQFDPVGKKTKGPGGGENQSSRNYIHPWQALHWFAVLLTLSTQAPFHYTARKTNFFFQFFQAFYFFISGLFIWLIFHIFLFSPFYDTFAASLLFLCIIPFSSTAFLVACYATLHPDMSVRWLVGRSVGRSVGPLLGSGPEGADDLCFHTYGGFSPSPSASPLPQIPVLRPKSKS